MPNAKLVASDRRDALYEHSGTISAHSYAPSATAVPSSLRSQFSLLQNARIGLPEAPSLQ
jgi:hypothetical protein